MEKHSHPDSIEKTKKKIKIFQTNYYDEFEQKGLEELLKAESDEEIQCLILKGINSNFTIETILKFATQKEYSAVVAGHAFNRIKHHDDHEIKKVAYHFVAKKANHDLIRRVAYKAFLQMEKIVKLPRRNTSSRKNKQSDQEAVVLFFPNPK